MSRRCLIIFDREVVFYCATSTCRESHDDIGRESWARPGTNAELVGNANIIQGTTALNKPSDNFRIYAAAVEEYTMRNLSYQSDGLNAFKGMSALLGRQLQSEMMYGCPRNMLVNCLTWRPVKVSLDPIDTPERRMTVRKEDARGTDQSLRPLLPSWAWPAWKGHLKVQQYPYYYAGTELLVLEHYLGGVPQVKADAQTRHRFMTMMPSKEQPGYIDGLLPVFTKTSRRSQPIDQAGLYGLVDDTVPNVLELYTTAGSFAGEIHTVGSHHLVVSSLASDGSLDLGPSGKFALLQIWAGVPSSPKITPQVNVMLVETFEMSKETLNDMNQVFGSMNTLPQHGRPSTAQRARWKVGDEKLPLGAPEKLIMGVKDGESVEEIPCVILASKVGMGTVNFKEWMEAGTQETIVLLG